MFGLGLQLFSVLMKLQAHWANTWSPVHESGWNIPTVCVGVICNKSLIQPNCRPFACLDKENCSTSLVPASSLALASTVHCPLVSSHCLFLLSSPICVALEQELENVLHPLAVFAGGGRVVISWCEISESLNLSNGSYGGGKWLYVKIESLQWAFLMGEAVSSDEPVVQSHFFISSSCFWILTVSSRKKKKSFWKLSLFLNRKKVAVFLL